MFQKEVRCFNYRELMADALCYMRDHEYSQIVVRCRGNIRLLSGDGIVKWITDLLDHGEDYIARRAVGEAVPFEKPDTFLVMGPDAPVGEVRAAFRVDQDRLKITAVIITDDGTKLRQTDRLCRPLGHAAYVLPRFSLYPMAILEYNVFCSFVGY